MEHDFTDRQPEISVIVPVYNTESYLSDCLDRLLAQSFEDFEALLVDDGSTDGSCTVAAAYEARDVRVHLLHSRWNSGAAAARNFGMQASRGKYIVFLDPDDLIPFEHLSVLYQVAETAGADVVAAGFRMFFQTPEDGCDFVCGKAPFLLPQALTDRINYFMPEQHIQIAPWGKIYRKSFLDQHHMMFCHTRIAEDVHFHYQCVLAAPCYVVLPEILYDYRVRQGSSQRTVGDLRTEQYAEAFVRSLESFTAWMQQEPAFADPILQRTLRRPLFTFFLNELRQAAGSREEVYERCWKVVQQEPHTALMETLLYDSFFR